MGVDGQRHAPAAYPQEKTHCTGGEVIGRSLVRSQLVSLEFFVDIKSFRSHYGLGVDSASNEYQQHFLGVKAAGA